MKFIDARSFKEELRQRGRSGAGVRSAVASVPEEVAGESRTLRWTFSDGSVDRMGDTIAVDGWEFGTFLKNPVVLWAHDANAPPIGRASALRKEPQRLSGAVTFADAATYDFADTIFRLAKAGFLSAGSVGFLPLEWKWSSDPARPGGLDFTRAELLEFSICPVPANANALIEARADVASGRLRRASGGAPAQRAGTWLGELAQRLGDVERSAATDAAETCRTLGDVARMLADLTPEETRRMLGSA